MSQEKRFKKKDLTAYDLVKTNVELAGLKAGAIYPTQPIQVIMRHQQKRLRTDKPSFLSMREAYHELAKKGSKFTFFKGAGLGVSKEVFKNIVYKGALIKGAPHLTDRILKNTLSEYSFPTTYHVIQSIIAGHIAGIGDAVFGCPLEFCATYAATSQHHSAQYTVLEKIKGDGLSCLYQGFKPMLIKGIVSFSTLFLCTEPLEAWSRSLFSIEPSLSTPWYCTATSALGAGFFAALTSSGFDIVKTQAQMPDALQEGVIHALKNNVKIHGYKGVTTGLWAKLFMSTLGMGITFFATQRDTHMPHEEQNNAVKTVKPCN